MSQFIPDQVFMDRNFRQVSLIPLPRLFCSLAPLSCEALPHGFYLYPSSRLRFDVVDAFHSVRLLRA